jgi:hypothetical protein
VFDSQSSRRSYLTGVAAVLAAGLAGCTDSSESTGDGATADTSQSPGTADETTAGGTTGEDGGDEELDLREANVVDVAVEGESDGYRFDVTLHHDDDGEDGYANWWQVETTAGERLGRRELLHAHGTRPFTRSASVAVPGGVSVVVVRGHDQTHGYGGQAALVTLSDGAVEFVQQGSERQPLGDGE